MSKRRVEWNVRLLPSNLVTIKGELIPQLLLTRTWTLDDLVARITGDGGCALSAENLRCAADMLMHEMEDCLLEGSAVSTPLGTLAPSVTGTWSVTGRLQPQVRQQNAATVRFTLSPRMKKALANPLFHEMDSLSSRLCIDNVLDTATRIENRCLTPGGSLILHGCMLLMNGDLPQRGVYLTDAVTGRDVCHITPAEMVVNTRRRIILQLPRELPAGEYLLRVISQCTTSPRPMKQAAEYITRTPLTVGDEGGLDTSGRTLSSGLNGK